MDRRTRAPVVNGLITAAWLLGGFASAGYGQCDDPPPLPEFPKSGDSSDFPFPKPKRDPGKEKKKEPTAEKKSPENAFKVETREEVNETILKYIKEKGSLNIPRDLQLRYLVARPANLSGDQYLEHLKGLEEQTDKAVKKALEDIELSKRVDEMVREDIALRRRIHWDTDEEGLKKIEEDLKKEEKRYSEAAAGVDAANKRDLSDALEDRAAVRDRIRLVREGQYGPVESKTDPKKDSSGETGGKNAENGKNNRPDENPAKGDKAGTRGDCSTPKDELKILTDFIGKIKGGRLVTPSDDDPVQWGVARFKSPEQYLSHLRTSEDGLNRAIFDRENQMKESKARIDKLSDRKAEEINKAKDLQDVEKIHEISLEMRLEQCDYENHLFARKTYEEDLKAVQALIAQVKKRFGL